MTLLEEIKIFIRHIIYWVYSFLGLSVFFFVFGLQEVMIYGHEYLLPMPTENSFSVQIFNQVRYDLLPSGVQLITTNPMSAFVAQICFSMLLGFITTIPFFLYAFILYIKPSLFPYEKKIVMWSLFPFVMLFFSGALFSYFLLIPATFKVLYPYTTILGAVPLFSVDEFIYYVIGLMLAVGMMFLLPLFMIVLSTTGIIEASFWLKKWQYAFLFFLILSAIITPDGTGVTMIMLFLPLVGLYFAGYFFANKLSKSI